MGKHARKRQKTEKISTQIQPLGSNPPLQDDSAKDDEERRLESLLFGTPFVPSGSSSRNAPVISDEEDDEGGDDVDFNELDGMMDSDLFFVDDEVVPSRPPLLSSNTDDEQEDEEEVEPPLQPPSSSNPTASKKPKPPAWIDEDDTTLQVSLTSSNRLRKLRDAPSEDILGGRDYERRLRRQYEKINPTPQWASSARSKLHPKGKKQRLSHSSDTSDHAEPQKEEEEDEEEDVDMDISSLLGSTTGILGPKKTKTLQKGTLSIDRLRDANQTAKSEGEIKALQFHPSPQIPVLLTASTDRRLRLFSIDGLTNPHLQTLHIPSLPLTSASFHPTGSSILLTGPRPFYYTYDLQSGVTHRSPRGLWGTTFNHTTGGDLSMEINAFDATGEVLAVASRRGYIHLVDWKSGAGQVVGSLKMNCGVRSLWWSQSEEKQHLFSLGEDSEVFVWDVGERRCVRRWKDDGGFGSRVMSGDRGGKYLAVGSNTGFVNVYGSDHTIGGEKAPKSLKAIGNLTTSISTLRFNHDSQLLAIASNHKKDQIRMIHLPSLTAFSNWPTSSTPLGTVTSIDFSTTSEYVAVGNSRGRVLLYHLRDFGASA